jgi:predicted  nucleic acid-binding Zn-ribbon protein
MSVVEFMLCPRCGYVWERCGLNLACPACGSGCLNSYPDREQRYAAQRARWAAREVGLKGGLP